MINKINTEAERCPRCGKGCNFTIINTFSKEEFCYNCMTDEEKMAIEYDIEKEKR